MMSTHLPDEFALVVACCMWPPSERRNLTIGCAAAKVSDWARFLRIVRHHRVAGLALDGLRKAQTSVPDETAGSLRADAAALARQNLLFAAESFRLQKALDDLGIPNLSVKGVTLAQLAYGSLAIKHSWDIDLLVLPEGVTGAIQALARLGYRASKPFPSESDRRYGHWLEFTREYLFFHESNSAVVELHWRLTDNEHFLPGVSAKSTPRTVMISSSLGLRTLDDGDLFVFLCVHGAFHGWARLKWLADVAALISGDDAERLEQRFFAAKQANAEHCVAQAYLLCDRLFGTPALAALSRKLRMRRRYRRLERMAFGIMTLGGAEVYPGTGSFDKLPLIASHFLLGHGWRYVTTELRYKLFAPWDLMYSDLETNLGAMYVLRRVASWLRRGGRARNPVLPAQPDPE